MAGALRRQVSGALAARRQQAEKRRARARIRESASRTLPPLVADAQVHWCPVILITCAVNKELAFFESQPHVEMLVTGVGPVEAAASVSRALAQSRPELVINAGIAGAFKDCAEIGEGVVVSDDSLALCLETGAPIGLPDDAH